MEGAAGAVTATINPAIATSRPMVSRVAGIWPSTGQAIKRGQARSQRVELGVKRGATVADLDDLLGREADHATDDAVRGQAICAAVDLADDQVHDLAPCR